MKMAQAQALLLGGQRQLGKRPLSWRTIGFILFLTLELGHPTTSQSVVLGESTIVRKGVWTVRLYYKNTFMCGASLIGKLWMVTAAHCVDGKAPSELSVMTPSLGLAVWSRSTELQKVKSVLIHPDYNRETRSGNLALIKLESPMDFTNGVNPTVSLPRPGQYFPDGMMATVVGWASPADPDASAKQLTIQEAIVPLMNAAACDDILRAQGEYTGRPINNDLICAGYSNEAKDACQGDSGCALASRQGGAWFLLGIGSFRIGSVTSALPSVFVSVSHYISWILENIASD